MTNQNAREIQGDGKTQTSGNFQDVMNIGGKRRKEKSEQCVLYFEENFMVSHIEPWTSVIIIKLAKNFKARLYLHELIFIELY